VIDADSPSRATSKAFVPMSLTSWAGM